MWQDTDPDHGTHSGFTIQRDLWGSAGMRGYVGGDISLGANGRPPNHLAGSLITALGGPDRNWFGDVIICGSRTAPDSGERELCGLTEAQERLISHVLSGVRAEA
ncbi:hypothetical protein [Streptomyces gilvosporeus]|uniref:Uncharacterized protein n=1 Tax=Streptomyces gilvosporeus TaxID=553510 RepID=A0A1V0TJM5_9ACTN|nr:hypothetical protein [Streptomyces gilvosporeus]ARF53147.1 hypothetical protein B1H19_02200 [Streptomyces gilvosporeus]